MRTIRLISSAVLAGTMALVTPGGAASAAPSTTYNGVFEGNIVYAGCATTPAGAVTTGTWSIMLQRTSAQGTFPSAKGTFDILVNGAPHVSYVLPGMEVANPKHGDVFSVSSPTGAGTLTVTVTKNGRMTYTIAPYKFGDLSCTSVTYPGFIS